MAWRARAHPRWLPLVLLAAVSIASFAARIAWIGEPCQSPCENSVDHTLVFDESYYVNAARIIAGLSPPPNAPYGDAPAGSDPNAEHPQLAKLEIAGAIELFGDGPFAWRIGAVVFGSLAILGMFALARAAGAGPWPALAAAALMALDNLLVVHGRIGTLDIYALAAMLWGAALYLRRWPLAAGAVIGAGACFKLVAPYVLLALVVLEALGWASERRGLAARVRSLLVCGATAAVVFAGLLALLDQVAPPWDPSTARFVSGGPLQHISHMLSYAASQTSPHGPHGIASYPWEWLGDYKPITYLNVDASHPAPGLLGVHPEVHFLGMLSPPILLVGLVALGGLGWQIASGSGEAADRAGLAWFLGTWIPFALLSLFWQRTTYLYYMVIVMPGLYLLAAQLLARARAPGWRRPLVAFWLGAAAAAVIMYPLTPLP